ncbi:iron(III) transport system ATP-binding protein [Chitinophaga rupis]|uniref:Iron(III) transport system ATP-binding protein n=1 Tax=Chitinophaga rupis TaxID=573321 RepID=A0A1H7SZM2_9BACT|nr:ABC transporter ATP-binding protein [Chitinophaga rupis]SEL78051.1 iron(III) transport system ATP-binding protein [Chitinophaga rupis]
MSFLTVLNLRKQQQGALVVNDVSFTLQPFHKIAIAGETGSGKSTLLKMIAGLVPVDEGTVLFEGQRVKGPHEVLLPGHPRIAYLSQHFELRNNYSVAEVLERVNLLEPEAAKEIYDICRITHLLQRRTDQLSGGEKQRIALARLLGTAPQLLLLDEPYSNLDMIHKNLLKTVIRDIGEEMNITCMLISHDPQDILSWADEVMLMKDGVIVQQGAPQQVYYQPLNTYAAGLLGKYNLLESATAKTLVAGPPPKGKLLLVRPEDLVLHTGNNDKTIKGKVNTVTFYGGYYELEVALPKDNITLKTMHTSAKPGDTVYISLKNADIWYI